MDDLTAERKTAYYITFVIDGASYFTDSVMLAENSVPNKYLR